MNEAAYVLAFLVIYINVAAIIGFWADKFIEPQSSGERKQVIYAAMIGAVPVCIILAVITYLVAVL